MKKILCLLVITLPTGVSASEIGTLRLPPGFQIEQLNFAVPDARQLALTRQGALIVGTRRKGVVYAIPQALTDASPKVVTLFDDLLMPSGVAVHGGTLYVGATSKILRVADIDNHLTPDPPARTITDRLPDKRHHGWKYLKVGPDGKLYVPVGAPCNICLSDDPRFASLLQMDPVSGSTEVLAHGIRNTVGFDWHPETGKLWFSDNGRDMLGDDIPAEEINVVNQPGEHFGYPFVHAADVRDPKFGDHEDATKHEFTPPVLTIQAHSAALGMDFYGGESFPAEYRHALFVAEHGSWNRSEKVGYQVSVIISEGGNLSYRPFVTGWLQGEDDWGRPNDVLVTPDGALLISDDKAGQVYRVTYRLSE